MLDPEEWDALNAQLPKFGEFKWMTPAEKAIQAKVEKIIAQHADGSDPLAPFGGLPGPLPIFACHPFDVKSIWTVGQRNPRRRTFFLVSTLASFCFFVGVVLSLLSSYVKAPDAVSEAATLGCVVLTITAVIVLQCERRARRAEVRRQRLTAALEAERSTIVETDAPTAPDLTQYETAEASVEVQRHIIRR